MDIPGLGIRPLALELSTPVVLKLLSTLQRFQYRNELLQYRFLSSTIDILIDLMGVSTFQGTLRSQVRSSSPPPPQPQWTDKAGKLLSGGLSAKVAHRAHVMDSWLTCQVPPWDPLVQAVGHSWAPRG